MIHSIPPEKYTKGCFAEFETYGSYVYTKYPGRYELRPWNSFRYAGYFLDPNNMQEKDWDWLSKDFYALSWLSFLFFINLLQQADAGTGHYSIQTL
jgi:hypothetical protein